MLDTHVLIWAVSTPEVLHPHIRDAVAADENAIVVSAVTAWEIAIKCATGRMTFPIDTFNDVLGRLKAESLAITPAHGVVAGGLPRHHRDPFDRMLVAQAQVEHLVLVTMDPAIARYDVRLLAGPSV